MDIKITVLVNVYNESDNIVDFLESLENQIYKNFEILIVDDGSTDDTIKLIKKFKETIKISIIKLNHVGLTEARKIGYNKIKEGFIIFFDADEIIDSKFLLNFVELYKRTNFTFFNGRRIPYNNGIISRIWFHLDEMLYFKGFNKKDSTLDFLMGGSMGVLKLDCEKIGGIKSGVIEDAELTERILKYGYKIYSTNMCIVYHKYSPSLKSLLLREMKAGYMIKNQKFWTLNHMARFSSLIIIMIIPFYFILLYFLLKYSKIRTFYIFLTPILIYLLWFFWTIGYIKGYKKHDMY